MKSVIRDSTYRDYKMWPLAVLTGDRFNGFFFSEEMYGRLDHFAEPKKTFRNNKVTVLSRCSF